MPTTTMITKIKLALRISTTAFDNELQDIIDDCLSELTMLGIYDASDMSTDKQIESAAIYYCKARFGENEQAEHWEKIYRDKVEKLLIAADYGGRGRVNGQV